ncbi:MAG: tRNA lysidine(34) synthetase TilS [Anaerolineales bacterium]
MNINLLQERLIDGCQLDQASPIVVGFSAGPDSLTLLHSLHRLNYSVVAAHVDHGLRLDSAAEEARAKLIAHGLGIPFFSERVDVPGSAAELKLSVEEAARELRYRFLFRIGKEQSAQAVAVAHTADDQVETSLMHLLRGSGSSGLAGMQPRTLPNPWSSSIPLVRPLLPVWRTETEEYCQLNQLQPLYDPSNLDKSFFRNRLRHETIPYLETLIPGFKTRLFQTADLVQAELELFGHLMKQSWSRVLAQKGISYLRFNREAFLLEPLAMRRALLRRAFSELAPMERNLDFDDVHRAMKWIENESPAEAQPWTGHTILLVEEGMVWISMEGAVLPYPWPKSPAEVHIEVPSRVDLNAQWRLVVEEVEVPGQVHMNRDPYQAWLSAEKAGDELLLRRRKPGDRFQPLGMKGSAKLSDFMINQKIPRRARDAWPLLCKGDEIIWVPGYQIAHGYRLQSAAQTALHVQLAVGAK